MAIGFGPLAHIIIVSFCFSEDGCFHDDHFHPAHSVWRSGFVMWQCAPSRRMRRPYEAKALRELLTELRRGCLLACFLLLLVYLMCGRQVVGVILTIMILC